MTLTFDELGTQAKRQANFLADLKSDPTLEDLLPKSRRRPDALVQATILTTCMGCGETYSRPNRALLLRYKRVHLKVRAWHDEYGHLPREMLELQERSPACEKCFKQRVFVFEEEE